MIIGPRPPQLPGRGLGGDRGRPLPGNPFIGRQMPPRIRPMPMGPRRSLPRGVRGDAGGPGGPAWVGPPPGFSGPGQFPFDEIQNLPPPQPFRPHPIDLESLWAAIQGGAGTPFMGGRPVPMEGSAPGQMNPFGAQGPDPYGIGRPTAGFVNDWGPGGMDPMPPPMEDPREKYAMLSELLRAMLMKTGMGGRQRHPFGGQQPPAGLGQLGGGPGIARGGSMGPY